MIHVAIGSEQDQRIPALVLEHSIRSRASRPVEIHWSWDPHGAAWNPMAEGTRLAGTNFSAWRWLAPRVVRGWAELRFQDPPERLIYIDCDQIVLADVAELEALLPDGKDIAVVVGAEGEFGGKTPEPDARETSVMVIRLAAATWDYKTLATLVLDGSMLRWVRENVPGARVAKSAYAALMQATWIPEERVAPLPKPWNHMNHYDPAATKLVHFTHVRAQPWKAPGHALAKFWGNHLREAVAAGAVTISDVEEAVKADHIDAYWLAVAREGRA